MEIDGATVKPPAVAEMSRNALDTLEEVDAIVVRRVPKKIETLSDLVAARNAYRIYHAAGREYDVVKDKEVQALPVLFEVREQSSLFCRLFCGKLRSFKLGLFPPGIPKHPRWPESEPLMTLHRPWICRCCAFCSGRGLGIHDLLSTALEIDLSCLLERCEDEITDLFPCTKPRMTISVGMHEIGTIKEEQFCLDRCFAFYAWAKSYDSDGDIVHTYRKPRAVCSKNCYAPSCVNPILEIDILEGEMLRRQVGTIKGVWPGCTLRWLCCPHSATNFVVPFPSEAPAEEKALLIGSIFYHAYLYFERNISAQSCFECSEEWLLD